MMQHIRFGHVCCLCFVTLFTLFLFGTQFLKKDFKKTVDQKDHLSCSCLLNKTCVREYKSTGIPSVRSCYRKIQDFKKTVDQKDHLSCSCLLNKTCLREYNSTGIPYLYQYREKDVRSCYRKIQESTGRQLMVVFLGDSTAERLLRASNKITHSSMRRTFENITDQPVKCPIKICSSQRTILQGTNFIVKSIMRNKMDALALNTIEEWIAACSSSSSHPSCPAYVITGILLHEARPLEVSRQNPLDHYKKLMETYAVALDRLAKSGVTVVFKACDPSFEYLFDNNTWYQAIFSTHRIELWNREAIKIMQRYDSIWIWTSAHLLVERKKHSCYQDSILSVKKCSDGLHHTFKVMVQEMQIFFNFMCNKYAFLKSEGYYCTA